MPVLEINPVAKIKRQEKHAELLARVREVNRIDDANYSVRTSRLAEIMRVAMPANADAIILQLEQIYASLIPAERDQFRRARDINRAFTWNRTPQGQDYWSHIHNRTWRTAREFAAGIR